LGHYQYTNPFEKELVRNTYQFFDCWNSAAESGQPTFSYTLEDGVKEGHLADYDIFEAKTKITVEGAEWEGDDYSPNQLERDISFESRNLEMVKEFARGEKERGGDYPKKTIVFAINKRHASQLTRLFNEVYSTWNGKYAEEITTDVKDPKAIINRFKNEPMPVIAVSVGMLDTGFDAPEVENLVMMRPTRSAILYFQMRGRGSRKATIIRNKREYEKERFLIYDFVGNARNFEDPKLKESKPGQMKPSALKPTTEVVYPPSKPMIFVVRDKKADEILDRQFVTVGKEGRRIPARTYWTTFVSDLNKIEKTEPVIVKIKADQDPTNEEIIDFEEKMNKPENYFNERNLQNAWGERWATMVDFVKIALGKKKFPCPKERLDEAFEAYKLQRNFTPDQLQFAKMLKERSLVDDKIDIEDLNQPPLSRLGGYPKALELFGEEGLNGLFSELNEKVIARIR
jgi:type I restriction enzyme R subunit